MKNSLCLRIMCKSLLFYKFNYRNLTKKNNLFLSISIEDQYNFFV